MTAVEFHPHGVWASVFAGDTDVVAGYAGLAGTAVEPVRFDAAVWDFRGLPGLPAHARLSRLSIDWAALAPARWELVLRELAVAHLLPLHPSVVAVPKRRRRPLPLTTLYTSLVNWRRFLNWLDEEGVAGLPSVTQRHLAAYLAAASELAPKSRMSVVVSPVRDFHDYGRILSERLSEDFVPWEGRSDRRVAGVRRQAENSTPFIPDEVLSPLLAGALFYVQTAAKDIIAARAELRACPQPTTNITDATLGEALDEYRRARRPLPAHPNRRGHSTLSADDPLALLNFSSIGRRVGRFFHAGMLSPQRRQLLLDASAELGTEPAGLWTPMTSVTRLDGTVGPWCEGIGPSALQWELNRLVTACFIVVAGLSGMRSSEVLELRRGCVERLEADNGRVRWRLHSRIIKHRHALGAPETWTVIEPVVAAVRVLEELAPPTDDGLLLTGATWEGRLGARSHKFDIVRPLNRFVAWQNEHGHAAGLTPIPAVGGETWRLTPRQFRRTLARVLAMRPHGTLASKLHLKHVSVVTTEGYWGPIGESSSAFLEEVEAQLEQARVDRLVKLHERVESGEPMAGGGAKRLRDDMAALNSELAGFQGTTEEREDRLRMLLRKRPGTLNVGMFNACDFTDAAQARCLRGVEDKSAPRINACQPTKCANAVITSEHAPRWNDQLLHIEDLRRDRKAPKHERERLAREADRIRSVVESVGGSS